LRAIKGGGRREYLFEQEEGTCGQGPVVCLGWKVGEKMNPQNSCFAEPPITPALLNLFSNFPRAITPILTPKIL